jgi:hypothetical protein
VLRDRQQRALDIWALTKSPSGAAVMSGFGGLREAVTILNPERWRGAASSGPRLATGFTRAPSHRAAEA